MRLGIDTYSLRWQGWSAFEFLEYSAKLGLDNVHFSGRQYFESLDKSEFWQMFPDMPARDLARFVALAQAGAPEPLDQLLVPPGVAVPGDDELGEDLKAQQRRHFEESVVYSREVLGLGKRGR